MAYDRIDWHSGGEYPDDLPAENGGIHIGMFLAWAFGQGMAGEVHDGSSTGTGVPSIQALLGRPMIRRSRFMQTITTRAIALSAKQPREGVSQTSKGVTIWRVSLQKALQAV
jgi:hypothetical protein